MLNNLYDAKPFTKYWYYENALHEMCHHCNVETMHYLMKYRVYLGLRFPIIPAGTVYYKVCSMCGGYEMIGKEADVAKIISGLENRKPIKYNKYSQLDLDGYGDAEWVVFGTDQELTKNIQLHLKDMKKMQK